MSKIRNWVKHPTGVDVWCHSEKQVVVTVEMQEERDLLHGDYYHAFAWGTVPPNTIGTNTGNYERYL